MMIFKEDQNAIARYRAVRRLVQAMPLHKAPSFKMGVHSLIGYVMYLY